MSSAQATGRLGQAVGSSRLLTVIARVVWWLTSPLRPSPGDLVFVTDPAVAADLASRSGRVLQAHRPDQTSDGAWWYEVEPTTAVGNANVPTDTPQTYWLRRDRLTTDRAQAPATADIVAAVEGDPSVVLNARRIEGMLEAALAQLDLPADVGITDDAIAAALDSEAVATARELTAPEGSTDAEVAAAVADLEDESEAAADPEADAAADAAADSAPASEGSATTPEAAPSADPAPAPAAEPSPAAATTEGITLDGAGGSPSDGTPDEEGDRPLAPSGIGG